jgi:hypothetical protein
MAAAIRRCEAFTWCSRFQCCCRRLEVLDERQLRRNVRVSARSCDVSADERFEIIALISFSWSEVGWNVLRDGEPPGHPTRKEYVDDH